MYYPMTPTSAMAYQEGHTRENQSKHCVQAGSPRLYARFLARVGRALALAGTSLRERYEPAFIASRDMSPSTRQSDCC
jgi:hypothetical protein